MKKLFSMLLVLVILVAALSGCSSPTEEATTEEPTQAAETTEPEKKEAVVVKFGNAGAIGEPAPEACQEFCDLANEAFDGEFVFEFYPAEQLGNEGTMMENLQVDLQQGMMCSLDSLASYSKDINILSMAFAFESSEHMLNYLHSEVADPIWNALDDNGFHMVNFEFQKNPRIFFCKYPLYSPADMVGMKYRIPNLPIFEKNALAMGATPTVVSWSEYPFALLQGVVDGGECSKDSYKSAGLYEAAKYVTEVNYAYPVECIIFSKTFWDSLTAEQQDIVNECAEKAAEGYNETIKQKWEDDKAFLIDEGEVTFVEYDRQAFLDAAAPLAEALEEEGFFETEDLYNKVQAFK
ncbi:TRAP-type C4-dicarboxylate transport system, substrate-binding protein [Dethiosulfatibacter aminovorans DSM 17477]|uniref:TRAP-type C4-dicarboxylate transport system, substrate-binding protein n=1 Tax=Dethiosulfatibacter aminovorans DSM 17477 TaxID=1121476 RepID=A0A1M6GKE0_9FIRM|nr:TRAP transporter substrate-binding protein [Dethiosulfatibacter aminovorans]SHJ10411.1 TRAP-type C4-dicarboxylate transport system, substrate-binding protein [Dethiosulfatibacter aminovorans DSM 17477]